MSLNLLTLPIFDKQAKRLAKKYKSLAKDLRSLHSTLLANPQAGVELSHNCYKIRLANSSTQSGKSGGFRVIYYYLDAQQNLYLMTIYSKSEQSNIETSVLLEILKEYGLI
ncbi:MAG: addiction module toxin RelE [Venatoribacter sp.]